MPVLVVARFDSNPRIVGWLFASFGLGALLGNAISYRVARRIEGTQLIATFILGQALPLWLLTLQLPAAAYAGALAVSGIANGMSPAVARDDDVARPAGGARRCCRR